MSIASRLKSGWHRVDQPKQDVTCVNDLPAEAFVDLAYQVILGRKPERNGLEHHAAQLSAGVKTRAHLVHEIVSSEEFKTQKPDAEPSADQDFVRLSYPVILGREANPEELADNTAGIRSGKLSRGHFLYLLYQSREFQEKASKPDAGAHSEATEEAFVKLTYPVILGREATPDEIVFNANHLRAGKMTRGHLLYTMYQSREFLTNTWAQMDFWLVMHRARLQVAAQLPKAERIVDLGGSSEGNPSGALLMYGYPYMFKRLTIVELPRELRHELYTEICGEYTEVIPTPQGPVDYVYASMSDLSAFGDGTVDLVYAGQSIEHVPVEEAKTVLREVHRVLKPGGHFCFDTPNRRVTVLQFPDFVVDDHKYEYTCPEMVAMLEDHGFAVREAKGMALMDRSVREGRFDHTEVMGRDRLYDDVENCFLMYFKAQKV